MTKSWRRYEQTPSLPGPSCRNAADGACPEGRLRIIGWRGWARSWPGASSASSLAVTVGGSPRACPVWRVTSSCDLSWLRLVRTCRPLSSTPSDTELVPLWVGEHHPPGPVVPTKVVEHHRAQLDRALHLLVSLGRGRPQIKMDAVLRRLPLRDTQEQQPRLTRGRRDQYRVVLGHVAGPDFAFEQRAPERGEGVRVARVECDLVNLQRSIFAVRHGLQRTTCCVHCRIKIRPPLV